MKFKNSFLSRSFAAMALLSLGINMTACDLFSKQKRQEEKARIEDEIKQTIEAEKADEAMVSYNQEIQLHSGISGKYRGTFTGENGTEGTMSLVINRKIGSPIFSGLSKQESAIRSAIASMSFEAHLVVSSKDNPQLVDCYANGIPMNPRIDNDHPEALKFSCPSKQKSEYSTDVFVYLDDVENGLEPYQVGAKQVTDILQRRNTDQIAKLRAGQKRIVTRMSVEIDIIDVVNRVVRMDRDRK